MRQGFSDKRNHSASLKRAMGRKASCVSALPKPIGLLAGTISHCIVLPFSPHHQSHSFDIKTEELLTALNEQ
ncbi:hypothetical protein BD408DRAFT_416198 [Parasitella parasitica]|nr:hypothetical protein BD408DRAFT_416198 [Parasitella parasitica]